MVHRAVHMGHPSGGDEAWAPHGHSTEQAEVLSIEQAEVLMR